MSTCAQKVAVVTGSNKGIGYAIVKGLCEKFRGDVYLTARDENRGQAAVDKLKKLGFNPKFHQLDITDQASIERLKNHLKNTHGGLDLLINNAGIYVDPNLPQIEQAEKTLPINYTGLVKVCDSLFPILRKDAKVVNMSSSAGHLSNIISEDLKSKFKNPSLTVPELNKLMEQFMKDAKENKVVEKGWASGIYAIYAVTKVAVSALTIVQQKNFDNEQPNRNIAVNSVHPGYVDTDLSDHKGVATVEQGAKAPLWLALEANVKGKYVWSDSRVVPWDSAQQPAPY